MKQKHIIILLLSIIIMMIGSFVFWWKTQYKPALNNSNDQYQVETQPQESIEEEQPILKTEKDLLPSCYGNPPINN